jgi:hypothetical protein
LLVGSVPRHGVFLEDQALAASDGQIDFETALWDRLSFLIALLMEAPILTDDAIRDVRRVFGVYRAREREQGGRCD